MLESKVFTNGSTTPPKPVRDALGIKAGDRVRYVISEKGVQVFKILSEKVVADEPALCEAREAAEKVLDENRSLPRKLK